MGSSPTFRQEDTNQRSAQLQPFIQQQCSAAVQSLAQELGAQLKHLGQPGMDLEGARLVEQALLLGLFPPLVVCHVTPHVELCHGNHTMCLVEQALLLGLSHILSRVMSYHVPCRAGAAVRSVPPPARCHVILCVELCHRAVTMPP